MRFDKGWIKVWRFEDEHWLMKDFFARGFWVDLLLMANYKTSRLRTGTAVRELPPGTIVTSLRELAARTGLSTMPIRTIMQAYENDHMIITEKSPKGTIITICNWDKYQLNDSSLNDKEITQKSHDDHTEITRRSHDDHISKECKKERKNTPPTPKGEETALMEIWNAYTNCLPKAIGMNKARLSATKARLRDEPDLEVWKQCAMSINAWDFGRGNNDRGWQAGFDYFIRPATIIKFKEGGYGTPYSNDDFISREVAQGLIPAEMADEIRRKMQ